MPDSSPDMPAFDPADFSQVLHHGRVVLARRGLFAYVTIVRSGEQCSWHDLPKVGADFETPDYFLPTYFGDTKILPQLPHGGYHTRPEHWSGFAQDDRDDSVAGPQSGRVILEAKSPAAKAATAYRSSHRRSSPAQHRILDSPVQSALLTLLRQREAIRSEALPKRKADAAGTVTPRSRRVCAKIVTIPLTTVTDSFLDRVARRLDGTSPAQHPRERNSESLLAPIPEDSSLDASTSFTNIQPAIGHRYERSFTIPDESSIADNDWDQVDRLLDDMTNRGALESSQALFGFHINDGSETERDTPSPPRGKLHATGQESLAVSTGHTNSSQTSLSRNPSSPPAHRSATNPESPEESFTVKHDSKHRKTQLAISGSSHVRVDTISDLAHVSFQEPSSSNNAAAGQLTSSQVQLNNSFYSSPARALEDVPSRDQKDQVESIQDTEVWGSPGSTEYAEEAEDERS